MNKYSVDFELYASTSIIVEAEDEEQAEELANDKIETPFICHHCAKNIEISDVGEITGIYKID